MYAVSRPYLGLMLTTCVLKFQGFFVNDVTLVVVGIIFILRCPIESMWIRNISIVIGER